MTTVLLELCMSNTILSAKNITFSYATKNILNDISLTINVGDKIALLGRNGMGKSTLLKILKQELGPDTGIVEYKTGLKIAQLSQSVNFPSDFTCSQALGSSNPNLNSSQITNLIQADGFEQKLFNQLSGGQQRRLLLRSVLVSEPDLIILDEPTNHIDIISIRTILKQLKHFHGACLIISHDRWFIEQIAQSIWDLHNGKLQHYTCDFNAYQQRKEEFLEHERSVQNLRRHKLKQEEHWLQRGVTARRKRNVGRLERLQTLRSEVKNWRDPDRKAKLSLAEEQASAKKVISINNLKVMRGEQVLVENFSYDIIKGEKIGLIGPNGVGKTTLINKLLTNSSAVTLGEQLNLAYFAQKHIEVEPEETALSFMSTNGEFVIQGDKRLHVASYLKSFNFDESQLKTRVVNLSGGERHRLMLAKCLANPANFLILDEPTNDLDLETLEILEDLLVEFNGTVLLISHDQKFLDNVITSCWVMQDQAIIQTAGDLKSWEHLLEKTTPKNKKTKQKNSSKKLSYNEQRRLRELPNEIEKLEDVILARQTKAAAPDFYQQTETAIKDFHNKTAELEQELAQLYALWEQLESY